MDSEDVARRWTPKTDAKDGTQYGLRRRTPKTWPEDGPRRWTSEAASRRRTQKIRGGPERRTKLNACPPTQLGRAGASASIQAEVRSRSPWSDPTRQLVRRLASKRRVVTCLKRMFKYKRVVYRRHLAVKRMSQSQKMLGRTIDDHIFTEGKSSNF